MSQSGERRVAARGELLPRVALQRAQVSGAIRNVAGCLRLISNAYLAIEEPQVVPPCADRKASRAFIVRAPNSLPDH